MKLTKLKKVIEYANAVALVNDKQNRQWISDGISWYAIEGLPEMQLANLQQPYDVQLRGENAPNNWRRLHGLKPLRRVRE